MKFLLQKTPHKSPDPLTITSSGPTMSLSLPSSASTSMSSPKEDTVAPLSPQDIKSIIDEEEDYKEGSLRLCLYILSSIMCCIIL